LKDFLPSEYVPLNEDENKEVLDNLEDEEEEEVIDKTEKEILDLFDRLNTTLNQIEAVYQYIILYRQLVSYSFTFFTVMVNLYFHSKLILFY